MIYKNFYSEIGKLLYALAKADGTISDDEIRAIHNMVVKDLVPIEDSTDEFGTDSAFYVEMEFDFLMENEYDPDDAFTSFIDYVDDHKTAFDSTLRKAIIQVAEKLADAFHQTNLKDKELLTKVKSKLEKSIA